ncbi:MAG TPA: endo alpha-1,4 polygalactosaminidase [Aggregatilineales bacterium]|nr:endo alpha-1,4 polygalactosaminidase [Aggregatilineales bacterium]
MKKYLFSVCMVAFLMIITPLHAQDSDIWQPEPGTTWQLQLTGEIDISYDVEMYEIDLFDAPQEIIDRLHEDGRIVICYFSAGSREDWRPDADLYPAEVIGKALIGWEGENWLDVRQIDLLEQIITARLDLAVEKNCDGVDPDNVNGYSNDTGFSLTQEDQIAFNIWLSEEAHARGLSIGLKNSVDEIDVLVDYFDWELNEQCFEYDECDALLPFIEAGKAVFGVEYTGDPEEYCPQALEMQFSWLIKTPDLGDEPPNACTD